MLIEALFVTLKNVIGKTPAVRTHIRFPLAAAVVALALVATSLPAQAAERQCGTVTEVGLTDPISGGALQIDGRTFDVGGLGTGNKLPPMPDPNTLQAMFRVGVRACVEGDFGVLANGRVRLTNGRIFLDPTSLPNTSTDGPTAPPTLLGLLGLVLSLTATWLAARRPPQVRTR